MKNYGYTSLVKLIYLISIPLALFSDLLPTFGGVRIVEVTIILLTILFLFQEKWFVTVSLISKVIYWVIALLSMYILIIGLIGQFYFNLTLNEFIEAYAPAFRMALYSIMFFVGIHLFNHYAKFKFTVIKVITICLLVHAFYALLQFSILTLNLPLEPLMFFQPSYESVAGNIRIVDYAATGFNNAVFTLANLGLMLMAIGIGLYFIGGKRLYFSLFLIFVSFFMIVSTFRRSQLIAALVVFLLVFLIIKSEKYIKKLLPLFVMILIMLIVYYNIDTIYQFNNVLGIRIMSVFSLLDSGLTSSSVLSLEERSGEGGTWITFLNFYTQYPLGTGLYPPSLFAQGSDSAYITYLVWGGPTLILILGFLVICTLILIYKVYIDSANVNKDNRFLLVSTLFLLMSLMITSVAGGATFAIPSFIVYWIFLSMLVVEHDLNYIKNNSYELREN